MEVNQMLEKRVESGSVALNGLLQRCQSTVGEVHVGTFRKLMESMVHSFLLYGAEAWGCIRRMDSLDQLQMRALRIFFGVNKYHPRVSLLAEMGNLPLLWEAKMKCVW